MNRTIIISNRLPVKISKNNGKYVLQKSEGGLATGLGDVYKSGSMLWVGWPGIDIPKEDQPEIAKKLASLNLVPVFLTQEEINLFYEGFSNEVLWPVFHYLVTYARFEQTYWDSYVSVNEKFATATQNAFNEGDKIWIQDYQLLCLPALLRERLSNTTIGFFQHIPFPSFEIFRLIPWRDKLIEGMLGADLIGFHTYDDVRHFLSTASRLTPVTFSSNIISMDNRQIIVEPFPMGIDYDKFEKLPLQRQVLAEIDNLNSEKRGRVALTIDRLDYSKGILERIRAFELLLQLHPKFIGEISLFMIVVPSRDTVPQYKELKEKIDQLVGNVNAKYRTLDWVPINYFYRSFSIETLSAMYSVADICLVTPMRDGMNLVSKEYVASRRDETGVLILSEMAGASKELNDAIIVNPNNIGDIMNAIVEAMLMPLEEQKRRMQIMRSLVSKFNVKRWVSNFLSRMDDAKLLQHSLKTKHAVNKVSQGIISRYAATQKRIIFLDYDGTLVGFKSNIDEASPDEELLKLLSDFSEDSNNKLVIISGRKHETLEQWFGHLNIGIIAEHGAWQKRQNEEWHSLPLLNDQWKSEIKNILEAYTDRTPGSFIEEKSFSLVWHYRKTESGLGELRANEIINSLRVLAADKGLQIMPGNKVIEFRNMEVNKGKAAMNWMHETEYDFILAMGDDHTDEDIFKAMPNNGITIKVGSEVSEAKFYLNDHLEVRELLQSILDESK
ncbi:bifunctional alpha,alpha-trehalose-phosphate synthase (UDP-forming)/trehalose-phosphatase [Pedobacter xixiisoli]|uniref:Trehalose 6-phosphate synthase /trehalose 6-phosphatase n=1 Tax=Pedobacter xixiisoli TaxID=1476464 RepID=A0A285ZP05_9SPHI|nr:bifunctional alpha,alpha-trehalose-phosphate synthase (UDP-forming)/trehalose-phosphatase [Pedobacter xixiisoli]SOD11384.1 trehalose 6-phosphate synthase /trehalose 6-phosphatase [Pedobacter xixiisoli]